MKRKVIMILTAVLTLAAIFGVAAGCKKLPAENIVETVKGYCEQAVNATKITQSVSVTNGTNLVSSKVIVYNIAADKSVSGTQTITTLNEDITSEDLYVEEISNVAFSAEDASSSLPTSITIDTADFVGGNHTFTEGEDYDTFSFKLKDESIAAFFGLTADEAESISDASVTLLLKDSKVTEYKATYATDEGNSVEIIIAFTYAE